MSDDRIRLPRGPFARNRRTVEQLLAASEKDSDTVSSFRLVPFAGEEDLTEAAVLVVKGRAHIEYLLALCERQGLLTPGKPVEGQAAPQGQNTAQGEGR